MKTTVAPFDTLAICLRIVCTNGTTIRVTRYPRDLVMSNGHVYLTGSGFDFTGYQATNGFSPSSIDLEGILGFAGISRDKVASGVLDGARAYLFACDYLNPVEDYEPIVASFLGQATLTDVGYRFEEMALIDALEGSADIAPRMTLPRHRKPDRVTGQGSGQWNRPGPQKPPMRPTRRAGAVRG